MEWRAYTRCQTSADCTYREVCSVDALCDCGFADGFANPPACDQFTSETTVVILINLLESFVATIAMVASAATLSKVVQIHPKGFFLSCSILCAMSAATGVAANVIYLIFVSTAGDVWPHDRPAQEHIHTFMVFLHATLYVCTILNLGLMWVEFVIASRRAQHIASNLRRTASFLYVFTVLWLVTSCVLLGLTLWVNYYFFACWVLLTTVVGVICAVVWTAGGKAMCGVFDRAATRSLANASPHMIDSPLFAAAELQKAHRMKLRSRTTRRSYRLNVWCGSAYILSSVVWSAVYAFELSHTALWLIDCVLRCSIYFSLCTMCFWLNVCVRVEDSASGLHADMSERSRRSRTMLSLASWLVARGRGQQDAPGQSPEATGAEQSIEMLQLTSQSVPLDQAGESAQAQPSTQAEQQSLSTQPVQFAQPTQPTQLRPPAQLLVQEQSTQSAQPTQEAPQASSARVETPAHRETLVQSAQPAEAAQRLPLTELLPPSPSRGCTPAHCQHSHHGAGGASTSQTHVGEQGANVPPRPARSGASLAADNVRVCIASGLVTYAATAVSGPQSTPSDDMLQGRRSGNWRDDIYCA